jgi:hypothetical protein
MPVLVDPALAVALSLVQIEAMHAELRLALAIVPEPDASQLRDLSPLGR